ncbi:sterol desaturase family protein [Novosphingobium aerophilum]|uniref:Sterol desaturase family protein n=1 Tax=Novosphingobium aerophilum TaxID=2839843 RepID=A0A7X1KB87_9SPHN|nr:sterol desaturase family protein [Novosphingobium aerophilum]MBC2650943.1 sterol desaturase family protein [Novosphingobium aerophilum]
MQIVLFLAASVLVICVITVFERIRHPGPTDWWRNLQAWALQMGIGMVVMRVWPDWHGGSLIDVRTMPFWLALPIFILVRDFLEFFYHYAQHRIPALWAMHSLHHSDPEMTALTTNRHFWGDQLIKGLTIWSATSMITTSTFPLMATYAWMSLYNYFIHANLKVDFGRWSWVLNCPAYHRRHHSRLPEHYDTNFAALFPIWDVLFRTYRRPDGWPPCGLDEGAPQSLGDLFAWPLRWSPAREPDTAPTAQRPSEA